MNVPDDGLAPIALVAEVLRRREELQRAAAEGYQRALKGMKLREGPEIAAEIPAGMVDAIVAAGLLRPGARAALEEHYCRAMPAMLAAQLRRAGGPQERLFGARLDLCRMPRLRGGLHALFDLAARAGLSCAGIFGFETPDALAQGRTLGEVYSGCHFGRSMPMLYAYPNDLDDPREPLSFIDARLVGPLLHELAHFRAADPPAPANLHEALAAYIGSEAWPAQVWPEEADEDALPGGAFFAALGGWVVRAVGWDEALRLQAGLLDAREALGSACAEALRLYGFLPFLETGAPHLLADAFHPGRWWKLIDLHRSEVLAGEFAARFVEREQSLLEWDRWLDALCWRDLPSWNDEPREIDRRLAIRAERALLVRAERRGLTFRARRATARLALDREQCLLRADSGFSDAVARPRGPDAIGAPAEHPYPPPLCRE